MFYEQQDKVIVQLPANFDLDKLLLENPPKFTFKCKPDCIRYIIGLFFQIPFYNKELKDKFSERSGVPIDARTLEKVIDKYKDYLEYLIEHEIISTDLKYSEGSSRVYKLNSKYSSYSTTEVELTDKTLVKQLKRIYSKRKKAIGEEHADFIKDFEGLEIDLNSALNYLHGDCIRNIFIDTGKDILQKREHGKVAVKIIASNAHFFTRDTTTFRFHSVLTIINKELRGFITYKGQTLTSIDISNSQPFLSTVLLNRGFWKEAKGKGKQDRLTIFKLADIYPAFKPLTESGVIATITDTLKLVEKNPQSDVHKYISEVVNGNIYETMQEAFKKAGKAYPRKTVKAKVLKAMYERASYGGTVTPEKIVFRGQFPDVNKIFDAIKLSGYHLLSWLLQTLESHIMLECVSRNIRAGKPDLPIFTIHDSIVCPVGNQEYIIEAIEKEFMKLIGVKPNLKEERWEPLILPETTPYNPLRAMISIRPKTPMELLFLGEDSPKITEVMGLFTTPKNYLQSRLSLL